MNFPLLPALAEIESYYTGNIHSDISNLEIFRIHFRKPLKPFIGVINSAAAAEEAKKLLTTYEKDVAEFNELNHKVSEHNAQIDSLIRRLIEFHVGFEIVPEQYRSKVWSKAYEDGHSAGWSEIANCLANLVEIFE